MERGKGRKTLAAGSTWICARIKSPEDTQGAQSTVGHQDPRTCVWHTVLQFMATGRTEVLQTSHGPFILFQVQLQQFEPALGAMQRVLELTSKIGDRVGLCDAYGVIADIYTEMNDLTKAGEYYDLYIENLTCDTSSDTM